MNAIEKLFHFDREPIRALDIDGAPWWVAADILTALDVSRSSLTALDDDEKGVHTVDTLGGRQGLTIINEPGLYSLIMRSRKAEAKRFKRWITHEVIPEIRRTGSYGASPAPVELDRRALALMVIEAEDARVAAEQRAVEAEQFQEHIELNDGLTVRDFHKKYFSEHGEREVNEFFYSQGLLLDERGKRWDERTQKPKDGKNHRRPTYSGKPFFYLHTKLDRDKVRREETRVRPGAPELALVEYMTKRGFTANLSESKELAA